MYFVNRRSKREEDKREGAALVSLCEAEIRENIGNFGGDEHRELLSLSAAELLKAKASQIALPSESLLLILTLYEKFRRINDNIKQIRNCYEIAFLAKRTMGHTLGILKVEIEQLEEEYIKIITENDLFKDIAQQGAALDGNSAALHPRH